MSEPRPFDAPEQRVHQAFTAFRYDEALAGAAALHAQALVAVNPALTADMALVVAKAYANQGRHAQALAWAERAAASADQAAAEPGTAERQAQAWVLVASECARSVSPPVSPPATAR